MFTLFTTTTLVSKIHPLVSFVSVVFVNFIFINLFDKQKLLFPLTEQNLSAFADFLVTKKTLAVFYLMTMAFAYQFINDKTQCLLLKHLKSTTSNNYHKI